MDKNKNQIKLLYYSLYYVIIYCQNKECINIWSIQYGYVYLNHVYMCMNL